MRVLLAMASPIELCPRACRLRDYLTARGFEVDIMAVASASYSVCLRERSPLGKAFNLGLLMFGLWRWYLRRKLEVRIPGGQYDVAVCFDPILLDLVCSDIKARIKIIDAREYYPEQFSDSFVWRLTSGRLWKAILFECLPAIDAHVTVSSGIAELYRRRYGMRFSVIPSLCRAIDTIPSSVEIPFAAVHHGNSNRNRGLDIVIKAFANHPDKFTLDLYLVETDAKILDQLKRLSAATRNVRVLPPLPYDELIEMLSSYDIGVFASPPSTPNLQYAMPNKVFEFVQARLMLFVSPLAEVSDFVRRHELGVVTSDFGQAALDAELDTITVEMIEAGKAASNRRALQENAEDFGRMYMTLMDDEVH